MADDSFYRSRAKKRLIAAVIGIVVVGAVVLYLAHSDSFQKIAALESSAEHLAAQEIAKNFTAPPPLMETSSTSQSGTGTKTGIAKKNYTLTRAGVVTDTNIQRAENGNLKPLVENATLDDIAQIRLDDMFAKQYFAHISPSSSSAITVAQAVGYDYIALGENLALGNFDGDAGVVTAWMNSPGHRANILDMRYTEIGVAVRAGNFHGANIWIAVQVFGKPLSDCPSPSASLDVQVKAEDAQGVAMQSQLEAEQTQINAMNPKSGDAYNQAVAQYNASISQYNVFVAQLKVDVAQYNAEVDSYNRCIQA